MTAVAPTGRRIAWLAVPLVLAASLAVLFFVQKRVEHEIAELPPSERRAFYERTLETLRATCSRAAGPEVSEYCRQQARFITHFPECDAACRDIAARFGTRGR